MSFGPITITTSATLIVEANTRRRNLTIVSNSSTVVFYGPDDSITTVNALPLYGRSTRDQDRIPEGWQGPIFGIVASGTADIRYWETESS